MPVPIIIPMATFGTIKEPMLLFATDTWGWRQWFRVRFDRKLPNLFVGQLRPEILLIP